MSLAVLALLAAAAAITSAVAAAADFGKEDSTTHSNILKFRERKAIELGVGCVYEGQWYRDGALVAASDACLHCVCARGALSCRRRACAAPPVPPPRCHLRYRREACCPEIHCPDRVVVLEHEASSRMEDVADIATPTSISFGCVEGGTMWAAGSALGSHAACETCFCLAGQRRCVRPRCLPPPAGCRPAPAPGVCCPHRYYCDHQHHTTMPGHHNHHDCNVNGTWVAEGSRAGSAERDACSRCFCLRGEVRCQPLQCAPALVGCSPLLRDGDCCPHQYQCQHTPADNKQYSPLSLNGLSYENVEDRSFHSRRSSKTDTPTKTIQTTSTHTMSTPRAETLDENVLTTTKVKRKINESMTTLVSGSTLVESTTFHSKITSLSSVNTVTTLLPENLTSSNVTLSTTEPSFEITKTDQPEGSVRIMINGTINCTTELSSTGIPVDATFNGTHQIVMESVARLPFSSTKKEADLQTTTPIEIITNRYMSDGLDENESFTINVTSSLFPNSNRSVAKPDLPQVSIFEDVPNLSNKKTKGDYDFDYTDPTLPPSLPNLKIIPFVAADALVDEEEPTKQEFAFPILEREDKFPVYYPSVDEVKDKFATRREDVYLPTQYPVFTRDGGVPSGYSAHKGDPINDAQTAESDDFGVALHQYTVTASLGNQAPTMSKTVTKTPNTSSRVETPAINLFSPPIETEGGFVPKGPGISDQYYAVYASTTQATSVPHLTTSMQLDTQEGVCLSTDGRKVLAGQTVMIACSVCTCVWSELHCSPRPCNTPPGCKRRPALTNSVDLCCGQLICDNDMATSESTIKITPISLNETKVPLTENLERTTPLTMLIKNITTSATGIIGNTTTTEQNSTKQIPTTNPPMYTIHNGSAPKNNDTKRYMTTAAISTTTEAISSSMSTILEHDNESVEYEEEEEDDGGFSFGSVLKLLLSDSYDSTTSPNKKKYTTTTKLTSVGWNAFETTYSTTARPTTKLTIKPFVPISSHIPYIPPKKVSPPTGNRIDHLVLGEATAIKKTTPRPYSYPITTRTTTTSSNVVRQEPSVIISTQKSYVNTRTEIASIHSRPAASNKIQDSGRRPASVLGGDLLKLAGCNIYGRMYRVGRIIAELSTPCQECTCTELGVQCRALAC